MRQILTPRTRRLLDIQGFDAVDVQELAPVAPWLRLAFGLWADLQVGEFFLSLRSVAESRLAEVQHVTRQYLEQRGALEPVDNDELARRVRAGEVTLIDVRPREEHVAAHIPGAISVPLADLGKRLGELQKRREVVAYCRGPYCVMALDAVDLLRRKGFRAHRMEHGVPEWRAQGWRVETGDDHHAGGRP